MAAQRKVKRARIGDVIEIKTPNGLAYAIFVGTHPIYNDSIFVLNGLHKERPGDFSKATSGTGYYAFYPLRSSVARGLTECVHTMPLPPGIEVPKKLRRAGVRSQSGQILTWVLEGDGPEVLRKELTATEKELPIALVWGHESLVSRLAIQWSPAAEG